MTASILQTGHNEVGTSVSTLTVTPTGLTAGSTVYLATELNRNNTVTSVVGSVNGAYTATGADADDGASRRLSSWRRENIASGTETITITYNSATSSPGVSWVEVGGVKTSSALDVAAAGKSQASTAGTDAQTSNAATNSNQPALIVSMSAGVFGNGPAAGTGYTNQALVDWGVTGPGGQIRIESKRITATGSQTATFTQTVAVGHLTVMAIFDELVVLPPQPIMPWPKQTFVTETIIQF